AQTDFHRRSRGHLRTRSCPPEAAPASPPRQPMPTSASSWSPLVNLFVARRGGVPGEILAHGAKLQVPPGLRVRAAQGESAANGARESLGRSIVEDEPGAIPRR